MVAALAVEREIGIETVLHYCCRDRNLIGMQSDLLGGYAGGLRNHLIVTGDPPKLGVTIPTLLPSSMWMLLDSHKS